MLGIRKKTSGRSSESVYRDVLKSLDSHDVSYNQSDDGKTVFTTFKGGDMPVKLSISVDDSMPILCIDSLLDFQAPSESYSHIFAGLNDINSNLHFGAFILDPESGRVVFRYHFMFAEFVPSQDMIASLVKMVVGIVDENDGNIKKLIPERGHFNDPMYN